MTNDLRHFALDEIENIARILVNELEAGSVVVLVGEMGSGKTTLVSACANVLGVLENVTSPTFSIIEEHDCHIENSYIKHIIHVDTYRIEYENEIFDLDFDSIFSKDAITFIEWGERIEDMIVDQYYVWTLMENEDGTRSISTKSRNDAA